MFRACDTCTYLIVSCSGIDIKSVGRSGDHAFAHGSSELFIASSNRLLK